MTAVETTYQVEVPIVIDLDRLPGLAAAADSFFNSDSGGVVIWEDAENHWGQGWFRDPNAPWQTFGRLPPVPVLPLHIPAGMALAKYYVVEQGLDIEWRVWRSHAEYCSVSRLSEPRVMEAFLLRHLATTS